MRLPRAAQLIGTGLIAALLVAVPTTASPSPGSGGEAHEQLPEYDVKAAYLFNFAKFVEWPESAFPEADAPLRLCVFGFDPFGDALAGLAGKSVHERRLVIERVRQPERTETCHVLFVARRESHRAATLFRQLTDSTVLTVTESESPEEPRGIINLVMRDNRILFQIAPGAAERRALRISSRLLQLAEVVEIDQIDGERSER